ncbi:hypothetical protein [Streptomyces sp. bgisy091]|uniref:hypothetical protein n=1 Tax=Streptomyces sp. bgisy091 TaxID=3413778 RepID=UPI003D75BB64
MDMLLLRVALAPLLVALSTAAQRRWGHAVGGSLAGLPLTSGPVVVVVLLQHGAQFTATTAAAMVTGLLSGVAFCAGYALASHRADWRRSLLCALTSFAVSTLVLWLSSPSLLPSLLLLLLGLPLVLRLWPDRGSPGADLPERAAVGMACRMTCAAAAVLLLTGVSGLLGPWLAGLLAPLQVIAGVLAVCTHRAGGARAARRFLRGVVRGGFAFAAFCTVLALALPRWNAAPTFIAATCAALAVQTCVLLRPVRRSS